MNFLLRNTLKKTYFKNIETSKIQSQRTYEYFFTKLTKMNNEFEKKMNEKESIQYTKNFENGNSIKKIKEWESF